LFEANPKSAQQMEGVCIAYFKLASVCKNLQDVPQAQSYFETCLTWAQRLADTFPQVPKYQRMAQVSFEDVP
ncbi:MAG TPA: hypothetical protein DCP28_27145, partial [Cytophagales bacterium]|nr:hypothetical protein [Cytophagales bacterium]